jgi:protease I
MTLPKVAILATNGFEDSELFTPLEVLRAAGCQVDIVSLTKDAIQGYVHLRPSRTCQVTRILDDLSPDGYDALVLPGGLFNPDALRTQPGVLSFVSRMVNARKTIAAICHGPQILISARCVKQRRMTAVASIQVDLENAGALVSDEAVVVDGKFITSRNPGDLPAFCKALCDSLGVVLRSELKVA